MDAVLDSRSSSIDEDDTEHDNTRVEDISCSGGSSSSDCSLPDRYGNNNDSYYDSDAEEYAPYLNYGSGDNDNASLHSCSSTEERYAIHGGSHPSSWIMGESTTNLLRANNPDFARLELDDSIDDIACLCEAIRNNKTVRDVEVHIEALEGLSRADQRQLADAICSLAELRSLLVYKNSILYIEPLQRHNSFLLENLRLRKLDVFSQPTSVQTLATALKGLPSLRSLDVGFDSSNTDKVLDALEHLKPVSLELQCFRVDYKAQEYDDTDTTDGTTMDTTSNDMLDDRIVMAIAEAVEHSQTLKTLALPTYSCTERCYETLIRMLKHNVTLERIDYWVRVCNLYYPDANETIDHLLHLNQTGARRLVRQKHISSSEVLQLMMDVNKDDVHTAYHLFSSHPSLLLLASA